MLLWLLPSFVPLPPDVPVHMPYVMRRVNKCSPILLLIAAADDDDDDDDDDDY